MKYQQELGIVALVVALGVAAPALAADVTMRSWPLPPTTSPTGHYPHDALVAEDGTIWYAALNSNSLGRFDPRTERFEEFFADIPDSGPHGLKEDEEGNIWFTAIRAEPTYIGMMNRKTGTFTEHPVTLDVFSPNVPRPQNAHSLVLDDRGYVWFSMISGDMLGRLDSGTGEIRLARSPMRNVGVYSVELDSQGTPWYSMFRTNRLVRVDPETMNITTYTAPSPDARPRRITLTDDDAIWYTDFARGYLGRFDTKSETWSEWPTPGGEWSRPYGMIAVGNDIWYSESWKDPSRLVRFDTTTEEFQSWPVEDCLDGAYNMVADAEDNLWFVCHDTDRLVKVEVTR